jgi:predicted secreted Zn-dependent protease
VVTRTFKDCNQAANALNGVEVGSVNSPFTADHGLSRVTRNRDGTFTSVANMTWKVDTGNAKTTVTRPSWPNMTPAEQAAADRFVEALRVHEEGHHQVVRDAMAQSPSSIRVTGHTAEEAEANLASEFNDQIKKAQKKIDDRNASYDSITSNGRNQAAVGGNNVFLGCP